MIKRSLKDVQLMAKGEEIPAEYHSIMIEGVSRDTREDMSGKLYIPIIGENFNGHAFVRDAIEKNGAVASLWQKDQGEPPADLNLIFVEDTIEALQQLASSYRDQIGMKVVGITGSNGKTTTKDMVTAVLETTFRVHKTAGNYNNQIGLPLTILSMKEDTEVAVLEMGMSGRGEIELLSHIAKPDAAIITNIGESHMQDLGSREGIAEAKLEIAAGLTQNGKLIINGDEPLLTKRVNQSDNIIKFGLGGQNNYQATDILLKGKGTYFTLGDSEYFIPVLGAHNVTNALASVVVGELFGVTEENRKKGLHQLTITGMRNEVVETRGGWTVINDAYNASPTSMRAALDLLASLDGYQKKIAVLGDMLELGDMERTFHYEIGKYIQGKNIDYVFTFGELGAEIANGAREVMNPSAIKEFANKQELVDELLPILGTNDVIIVKGSRGMRLEEVMEGIK
ncbi:UDP-N-acetylmuramoyl-tripeptide--D-alanyl-D-alanine ligase [Sutcliffiella rhizosphaerae]|uniref:UDP-N-acetylmuramoyl-tripeptide--D-alanyl-D-alanine ligase n=1 Tax=Sutcliffiella rhizosphaerae TaxID=2880967 RepID=A0ABM8YQ28_9BACI|nr:UDP-N-acetylmuramoyl-tripeptide--D-alanyl-D-alanine ligase [Sutcliffiella rhizosphaerae]CAG9622033.1 UDP-N-acetylmuramoyl-tripeptide--D-alanyl-D-alanine ligase [Sutcliffiella rhizosphaerae]